MLPHSAGGVILTHYRIDQTHSNAFSEWQKLGSPHEPNEEQYTQMTKAGQLATLTDAPSEVKLVKILGRKNGNSPTQPKEKRQ